jgi:transcriptional regulator with XRE-family HTH domain
MARIATVFSEKSTAIAEDRFVIVAAPNDNSMTEPELENRLGDYVRRVMQENGLDYVRVSKIASRRGASIGKTAVQQIVQGSTTNPGIFTVRALALGLGRPVEEVIAAALGTALVDSNNYKASDFANLADLYRQLPLPEQRGFKKYWLQVMEREIRRLLMQLTESD